MMITSNKRSVGLRSPALWIVLLRSSQRRIHGYDYIPLLERMKSAMCWVNSLFYLLSVIIFNIELFNSTDINVASWWTRFCKECTRQKIRVARELASSEHTSVEICWKWSVDQTTYERFWWAAKWWSRDEQRPTFSGGRGEAFNYIRQFTKL